MCIGLAFALGVDAEMLNQGILPFFIQIGLIGMAGGAVLGMVTGVIIARRGDLSPQVWLWFRRDDKVDLSLHVIILILCRLLPSPDR